MSFNIRHLITKNVEWNESLHNSPGRPQLPQRDTEAKEAKGQWVKLRYLRAITTQHQQKGAEANGREQGAHRPGTSQLGSGCGCQGMPRDAKVQHRNMTIIKIKFCLPTDGIWALERQPDRLVKEFAISLSTPVCNFNFQQLGSGHTTEKTLPQDCTKICHPAIEIYQDMIQYWTTCLKPCYFLLLQISTNAIRSSAFRADAIGRVTVVHPMKTSRAIGEALLAS